MIGAFVMRWLTLPGRRKFRRPPVAASIKIVNLP
jgi:hypothetical protein